MNADFTSPAYGDRSLADVVPAVARALGADLDGHPGGLDLPPAVPVEPSATSEER